MAVKNLIAGKNGQMLLGIGIGVAGAYIFHSTLSNIIDGVKGAVQGPASAKFTGSTVPYHLRPPYGHAYGYYDQRPPHGHAYGI